MKDFFLKDWAKNVGVHSTREGTVPGNKWSFSPTQCSVGPEPFL